VDVNLAAQAEQLVADLSSNITGTPKPLLNNVKRGLARSGGNFAPSVNTPWPQDYILGSGKQLKLYFQDLSIFEWVNGYIGIVQNQTNPSISRHMMNHLKNLMEDAVFYRWEVKEAHSVILTSLETGAITWDQKFEMAEKRRSAINQSSKGHDSSVSYSSNGNKGSGQNRFLNRQQASGSYSPRNQNSISKKVIKPCLYHNNNVCAKKGDHEEGNLVYRHVCNNCWSTDHIVKGCPFLQSTMSG
jgi:hypothetical protein